ncbi:hypothetical protein GCM10027589_10120 [Actinocorallia lasiicapitis]
MTINWRSLIVPGLVVVWAFLVTINHVWAGDMRLHLATVGEFSRHPWDPKDPLVGAADGSPYYSPYMAVLAWIARWLKAAPQTVLEWAGLVNVVFWTVMVTVFCRNRRLGGPWTAGLAIVFTLFLWGTNPRDWSGFLGLYSLSWTLAYPSMFAAALMLLAWDLYLRRQWVWLAPVLALVVLVHPFTALNTCLGLLAFVLAEPARLRPWGQYAAGAAVLALLLAWPWSDVFQLFGGASDLSEIHKELILDVGRNFGIFHYGLALAGLPALLTGARRRPFGRELLVLFGLAVTVVGLGAAFGQYSLARVLPVAVLPLHLALASYLGTAVRWSVARVAAVVLTLAALGAGIYGERGGLLRAWWGETTPQTLADWGVRDADTRYAPLLAPLLPGERVMVQENWPGRLVNGAGAFTVVPAWPYPWVDEAKRRADRDEFFAAPTTPERRLELLAAYDARCVMARWDSPVVRRKALPGYAVVARSENNGVRLLCLMPLQDLYPYGRHEPIPPFGRLCRPLSDLRRHRPRALLLRARHVEHGPRHRRRLVPAPAAGTAGDRRPDVLDDRARRVRGLPRAVRAAARLASFGPRPALGGARRDPAVRAAARRRLHRRQELRPVRQARLPRPRPVPELAAAPDRRG